MDNKSVVVLNKLVRGIDQGSETMSTFRVGSVKRRYQTSQHVNKPCLIELDVQGKMIKFELDTGAVACLIDVERVKRYFDLSRLRPCGQKLKAVNGEVLSLVGQIQLRGRWKDESCMINFAVCENSLTYPLLGRDAIGQLWPG